MSKKLWIGIAIGLFWLIMMGLLVHRELSVSVRELSLQSGERLTEPRESWMDVLSDAGKVGTIHLRQSPEAREGLDGAAMELEVHATVYPLGRIDVVGKAWRAYEIARADFEFQIRLAIEEFRLSGTLADGRLRAEAVFGDGRRRPLEFPVSDELIFSSGLDTALEFPSLEVGEEVRLESFDPLTLQKSAIKVRCVAEESLDIDGGAVLTRRLEVRAGGIIETEVWLDEEGETVQVKIPLGLMLRRALPPE